MKMHHWMKGAAILVVGGIIGYYIGKNAAMPAAPAPATAAK